MLLTIDAGNTRTKWAVFNQAGEIVNNGACDNSALSNADFSALIFERVSISNVAGEQHTNILTKKLAPYNATISWIKSTTQAVGVINHYAQATTLGSDRWAALIAAWHFKQAPCVVVNAGTAVTIDALSVTLVNNKNQANFIGGLILPGLNLMQQSLGLATAQLPKLNLVQNLTENYTTNIFAKNTTDAIHSGALHAVVGAITLMWHELKLQCKQEPFIVIGGGNASVINQLLTKENATLQLIPQTVIAENLVLQGLYLLDKFMQSDTQ
ncbi:MAG: hypothetical protein RIS87_1251 [Pseudomonadota bacterium]|jgi:type III pantothenate kinase